MNLTRFCAVTSVFTALAPFAQAGPPAADGKATVNVAHSPFEKGKKEFQTLSGVYWSFTPHDSPRPTLNSTMGSYRLGIMLNDVGGSGWNRGNYEFLFEAFGGMIYQGPGTALGGATLQLRYNFVRPDSLWVPYFQIGAGGVYSDMYKDPTRAVVGSALNFNLQGAFGARYFVKRNWAVNVEGGYRHISNAGFTKGNAGLNSLGGQVGVSWFF